MREQIISLIREGLGYPNLEQLIQLCLSLFDTNPVLYDVLGRIFAMLADEYDDQAITVERYESIMQVLQRPLIVAFSTVHFFLLNGDMELNKNRQIFVNKML